MTDQNSGGRVMIKTGDRFTATDKLNRIYTYEFVGINPANNASEIVLNNLDLNQETCVEAEWFRQRKIIMEVN
jgi:hypothetical protein